MSGLRSSVEPWVRSWWAGERGIFGAVLSLVALPVEGLYRAVVAVRRAAYQTGLRRAWQAPIPVVSVGNLVVGGTGKTPVTAWLVRRLEEMGARPAVLLRGYGQDEVRLHRRWNPTARVIADPDRTLAARAAAEAGATVAVLDDGFQHRRLARELDVVLIAAEQSFPGRCLPRGPYREGVSALRAADLVAVTRRTAADAAVEETLRRIARVAPGSATAVLRLAPSAWTDLGGAAAPAPAGAVLAVAGIAQPAAFQRLVEHATGGAVELLAFPDHHEYDARDARHVAERAGARTVVVTEKDAVKLEPLSALLPPVRVLVLSVEAERGGRDLEVLLRRAALGAAAERARTP